MNTYPRVYRVIACTIVASGQEYTQDEEVTSEQLGKDEALLVESGVLLPLQTNPWREVEAREQQPQ